jgi:phage-related protein
MDGYITIGTELDTKNFEAQIQYVESKMLDIEDKLKQADMGFEVGDTQKLEAEYEKLGNQLIGLKEKQEKYNQSIKEVSSTGIINIQSQLSNIGNSIEGITKKVFRWGLAVFGIRSAYMAVRQAMSIISSQDEQLAADIDYMKNAIAYTLEPVVRGIVNLMKQLMFYVGYVVKAWTGKNIFASANKSLKKTVGHSKALNKELKKTNKEQQKNLSSLDEITNLEKQSADLNDSGAGGGAGDLGGGVTMPSFDLTNLENMKVPEWLQWIVDHKDEVIAGLLGIAGGLVAMKLGFKPFKALGIGLIIAGIAYAIEGLLEYLKNPTWKSFGKIIQGIGVALIGLGILTGGWAVAIVGVIVLIAGTIIKYWDEIKSFLQKGIDWLTGKSDWVHKKFGNVIGGIYDMFVNMLQEMLNGFDQLFTGIRGVFDGIITFIKGVFSGNWKEALNGLGQIFSGFANIILGAMKVAWSSIIVVAKTAWDSVAKTGRNAWNGLIGFIKSSISAIGGLLRNLGSSAGNIIGKAFRGVVNGVLSAIEFILNNPIRAINLLIGAINKLPGIRLSKLQTFRLPRLARGGIVNNPGPGVMMGNYVAGERGAEAILPLKNSAFVKDFAKQVADNMQNDNTDLLIELNRNILELANKPTILNVNGKDLAQAIYKDIENEKNRLNTSTSVTIK